MSSSKSETKYWWHLSASGPGRRNPVLRSLRELELLGHRAETKFVPDVYKFASVEQRLAMLQGLMDTDGSADKSKPPTFTSVSRRLADDAGEIVRSLGGICRLAFRKGNVLEQYCLSMRLPSGVEPFALTRKAAIYRIKVTRPWRMTRSIVSVYPVGPRACRCLVIATPDHSYLGEHFTVVSDGIFGRCAQSKFTRWSARSCSHDVR